MLLDFQLAGARVQISEFMIRTQPAPARPHGVPRFTPYNGVHGAGWRTTAVGLCMFGRAGIHFAGHSSIITTMLHARNTHDHLREFLERLDAQVRAPNLDCRLRHHLTACWLRSRVISFDDRISASLFSTYNLKSVDQGRRPVRLMTWFSQRVRGIDRITTTARDREGISVARPGRKPPRIRCLRCCLVDSCRREMYITGSEWCNWRLSLPLARRSGPCSISPIVGLALSEPPTSAFPTNFTE